MLDILSKDIPENNKTQRTCFNCSLFDMFRIYCTKYKFSVDKYQIRVPANPLKINKCRYFSLGMPLQKNKENLRYLYMIFAFYKVCRENNRQYFYSRDIRSLFDLSLNVSLQVCKRLMSLGFIDYEPEFTRLRVFIRRYYFTERFKNVVEENITKWKLTLPGGKNVK